jgi:hypothetical protein
MNSNPLDDLFDSITITTSTTRTYSLQQLDNTYDFSENSINTFDQHLTLHSLVSFKEATELPDNNNSGVVRKTLRILNNSGVVKTVDCCKEQVLSTAVLEKGTHKLDPCNKYDPTMKSHKRISPEMEGVNCVLTSDKYDPIYTKPDFSSFL